MKVFHNHQLIAEHAEASDVSIDKDGTLQVFAVFDGIKHMIASYPDGTWHGAGTIACAGPPEDNDSCEVCRGR